MIKSSQSNFFSESVQAPKVLSRRNDVRKGDAAEMYVIAKLLSWGYDAHDARRDLPYDVIVDLGSARICRLQVKCRSYAKNDRWTYHVVRGNWRSATGTYNYEIGDYDASVFFALSLEKAIFRPGIVSYANFRTAEFLRTNGEIESWECVVKTMCSGLPQAAAPKTKETGVLAIERALTKEPPSIANVLEAPH